MPPAKESGSPGSPVFRCTLGSVHLKSPSRAISWSGQQRVSLNKRALLAKNAEQLMAAQLSVQRDHLRRVSYTEAERSQASRSQPPSQPPIGQVLLETEAEAVDSVDCCLALTLVTQWRRRQIDGTNQGPFSRLGF